MKLTFLGTRGYIEAANRRHRRHSALLVTYYDTDVMIDCGADWKGEFQEIGPDAIVLTHAHPDHAFGLQDGTDCPVYATAATWSSIEDYPIDNCTEVKPRVRFEIGGVNFEAFPVMHSLRAPAVGYRIEAGRKTIFYVPDVVDVHDREAALAGCELFIGDGATLTKSLVRRHDDKLFGHTTVRAQIGWCQEAGIPRALFTHCGSEIVEGDERTLGPKVEEMGRERGVDAAIAHDGMSVVLR
ncbi:MBL fold metallo-hydrolase [Dichotomicrobium thermohalophilum]|nr:MBL fold metallo-hydrolase [Dichotomicrobium thermohalophilum]